MVIYLYRCPVHGEVEVRKPMAEAGRDEWCPACLGGRRGMMAAIWSGENDPMRRVYTPPVTDCHSFGKNQYGARTPEHLRRPRSEDQALAFRDAARAEGTRRQWGPGRTTGT